MRVEEREDVVVLYGLAALVHPLDDRAGEVHAEASVVRGVPLLVRHFLSVRPEPHHFPNAARELPTLQEPAPAEHRMLPPERDHLGYEILELLLFLGKIPVEPGSLVVLAIGVVVPVLRVAQLV